MAVGGNFFIKAAGDFKIDAANITAKAQADFDVQAVGALGIKGNTTNIEAVGEANYLSGGATKMDYSQGQFGNGAAGATDLANIELTPPPAGDPLNPTVPQLIPPDRRVADGAAAETPEDYATPEGRAQSAQQSRESGVANPPPPVNAETPAPAAGNSTAPVPTDCKIIYATTNFTDDYRMSKNFTLGMLMAGGLNGQHKLVDQQLTGPDGKIRLYTVQEIVCNLAQTAQNILEPALAVLPGGISGLNKQWKISSGYRLKGVIKTESPNSSHCKGFAIDIALLSKSLRETHELAVALEKILPYDQCILEYRFPGQVWVHLGYGVSQRKMAFTMLNDKTHTRGSFALLDSITPPGAVVKG